MKNRLKYWRHIHQMEREQFANFLGVPYNQYTKWEKNKVQPSIEKLWQFWLKIKTKYPEINLQDLLEEDSQ